MIDPRTPVVIGGGQLNRRTDPIEPVDMIVEAVRLAAADGGAPAIAEQVDSVRVVGMLSWRYRDPGLLVGERLGAPVRHTVYTGAGGSHPQALVNDAATDVLAGRCDVVVVSGAEAWRTRMALKAQGERPDWTRQDEAVPLPELLPEVAMRDETELVAGLDRPTYVYPLFEQALRIAAGRTMKEHRRLIAEMWARFSDVASRNPAAWMTTTFTAEEIEAPSPRNRLVSWPYTKLMVSNNAVEQAAAVIVCSVEAARRAGVPEDRWVFLRSGAEAADTDQVAARPRLDGSPAIRAAGAAALAAAGVGVDELGPIDLYSCFPSAVQVAARELGLPVDDPQRPLTVTGGLTFAGGPWNNYSTHAIAAMVGEVRSSQQPGLVTANSGYLTKHSLGVYAPSPGDGFRRVLSPPPIGDDPAVDVAVDHDGPAVLESWTVRYDRDGRPEEGMAALRTPQGARCLARTVDQEAMGRLIEEDCEGAAAQVRGATFSLW